MNTSLLHTAVQNFININLKTDITKLILKGSPFEQVSIQEIASQIEAKKKCEKKLPTWFQTKNIYFPNKLNIEQTSSEITANYKSKLVTGNSLIDITGGFGVDAFYFSKHIKNVTHCELNTNLQQIVAHNIKALQIENIKTFAGDGLEFLKNESQIYNWIYVDPSRRSDTKERVFLLKDCLPNVPENLDLLFEKSDAILLKISPILDISSAIQELKFVKKIHIVAVNNDVKELLFILKKDFLGKIEIETINFKTSTNQNFNFIFQSEAVATYAEPKKYIYEPNAAILKAGAFNQISQQLKIDKLHQHSHLYTSNNLIQFPGRRFKIKHCISYDKKLLKKLIPSKKANITTRNFPETVNQIRKKTGLKEGGNLYLFFTTNSKNNHVVLICEKV
ncbi:class I SAM-dependent methyltransferase [Lutibacter holmesii]|uniref:Class I SAM-dependent methyltransferase n=1 Tax=Lutibacter holmesii TaxID=1137985 RepID=A0ABW3WS42_9FLAO